MVAALFDASRKLPRILSCFPPELKLLCLQGTHDQTVDFHSPLKLYETPVKLDLLYLCGWSHYVPKHSGADRLIGLVTAWLLKALAAKAVSRCLTFSTECVFSCIYVRANEPTRLRCITTYMLCFCCILVIYCAAPPHLPNWKLNLLGDDSLSAQTENYPKKAFRSLDFNEGSHANAHEPVDQDLIYTSRHTHIFACISMYMQNISLYVHLCICRLVC